MLCYIIISITKFSDEAYDPWGARSTWATGRATWLALAGSIWLRWARSGCFERPFSTDLVVLPLEPARPRLAGTPWASIFESETIIFSKFLRATNVRYAKRPTSKKHCKNQHEMHFGTAAQRPQVDARLIRVGPEERSAKRTHRYARNKRLGWLQANLGSAPGVFLGCLGAFRAIPRALLGQPECVLKPFWARPGCFPRRY